MANEQNLIPVTMRTPTEQREISRKGGRASAEKKKQRRTFREIFETILQTDVPETEDIGETARFIQKQFGSVTFDQAMALATALRAMNGDTKAFEIIRDTVGEKPNDKLDVNAAGDFKISVEYVDNN